MIIIYNKRTSKKKAIKRIVNKYKKTDLDANEDTARRLEKELNDNIEEYAKVIITPDEVIKSFKKKFSNDV